MASVSGRPVSMKAFSSRIACGSPVNSPNGRLVLLSRNGNGLAWAVSFVAAAADGDFVAPAAAATGPAAGAVGRAGAAGLDREANVGCQNHHAPVRHNRHANNQNDKRLRITLNIKG